MDDKIVECEQEAEVSLSRVRQELLDEMGLTQVHEGMCFYMRVCVAHSRKNNSQGADIFTLPFERPRLVRLLDTKHS